MRQDDGVLSIGALTTHHDIETAAGHGLDRVQGPAGDRPPHRAPARPHRGTLGGSIAQADPCAEWRLAAVLLGAETVVHGLAGTRTTAAGDLFTGAGQTALHHAEIITELRFPRPVPTAVLVEFAVQQGQWSRRAAVALQQLAVDPLALR